jgi:hypothetical protein
VGGKVIVARAGGVGTAGRSPGIAHHAEVVAGAGAGFH